jgi:hypothetical protein
MGARGEQDERESRERDRSPKGGLPGPHRRSFYSNGPALLAALALAALAPALAGCGDQAPAAPQKPRAAAAAKPGTGVPSPQGEGPTVHLASNGDRCRSQLGGFLRSMERLRGRLVAGVSYRQYVDELKDVRGAYDGLPVKQLQIDCLQRAGTAAESGFNEYIAAGNLWGDCVEVSGCGAVSIEGKLQRRWRLASKLLSEAQAGLARK